MRTTELNYVRGGVMNELQQFERYCKEIREIDGVKTCIVSSEYLDDILADSEVFSMVCQGRSKHIEFVEFMKRHMQYLVKEAKSNPTRIFLAFAEQRNSKRVHLWWEPINCYKDGDVYYHVYIRDNWVCMECRQNNLEKFIMPLAGTNSYLYAGTDNQYPPIAPIFKMKKCVYCEKPLQYYFICTTDAEGI